MSSGVVSTNQFEKLRSVGIVGRSFFSDSRRRIRNLNSTFLS